MRVFEVELFLPEELFVFILFEHLNFLNEGLKFSSCVAVDNVKEPRPHPRERGIRKTGSKIRA
jgi:hypothetical protein